MASWQYGLGKTVAFTSDASGRWARNWLSWGGFATFWNQVISYASSPVEPSNIELAVQPNHGMNTITVIARDETGETLNSFEMSANIVSQEGQTQIVLLEQTGPGKYQAQIDALEPGSYTISLSGTNLVDGESLYETFGWSQSYSPEYIPIHSQTQSMTQISPLVSVIDRPNEIFEHNLEVSSSIQPVWQRLLVFAAILLVLDIAVRRIKISNQDVAKSWDWLKNVLLPGWVAPRTRPEPASQFSALLDLKQQRQKIDPSATQSLNQPLIIHSKPIISNKNLHKVTADREISSQRTTAATLLSNKRERKKRQRP